MARNFGSTGASSLLRSAEAGLNKTNTYNDAIAAYNFDLSAKTEADYKNYSDYLSKRVNATQGTDPSKALTLQRTLTSANRSFNSAQIGRATTQVEFGNMTNRDKYNQIGQLYRAAAANGDDNLAQSLFSRMASLSVTIQSEDTASANAATAAGNKAASAGINKTLDTFTQQEQLLKKAVTSGQITTANYEATVAKLNSNKAQAMHDALNAGGLSDSAAQSLKDKFDTLTSSQSFTDSLAKYPEAAQGIASQYLKIDPAMKNPDGTVAGSLANLPGKATQEVKLPDGSIGYTHSYSGGFGDYQTDPLTGKTIPQANATEASRLAGINSGKDYIFGQVGRDAKGKVTTAVNPIGGVPIKDAKGNWYVVDQNGAKHYVNTDPNANLQRSSTPINDLPKFDTGSGDTGMVGDSLISNPFSAAGRASIGHGLDFVGKVGQKAGQLLQGARNVPGVGAAFGAGGDLLSNLFNRNDQAVQQSAQQKALEARIAATNQVKDAATLAASRRVLPVFKPAPPPAPPKITAKPSQYNLPALPALVPLGKTGVSVPSSTGNYQKDVLNLGRSLGGLI